MRSGWKATLILALVSLLTLTSSCKDNDDDDRAPENVPMLKGKITSYNEFGAAMLSVTESDMQKAGFTLGDVISVIVDNHEIALPYYDGFYTQNGEFLCVAYPTYPSIAFTCNNIGLPDELTGLEGHDVTIKMRVKGGRIDVQKALSMKYTNNRSDYSDVTDADYANARPVIAGKIAEGVLHRSSSPFCNDINRATYVSEYMQKHDVKTVLNLADTKEKMLSYTMPPFSNSIWESGDVILCPLKADPLADDFNDRLIEALKELPSRPGPYIVHCMEGKDRTGYVCALLEGLCGATYDEIVADYLETYDNYYQKTPEKDRDVCNTLVQLRLKPCLMHYANFYIEKELPKVNFADAFSQFLLEHGMTQQEVKNLVNALTKPVK